MEEYSKILSLTDEEVYKELDKKSKHTSEGLSFWIDEINRRNNKKTSDAMIKATKSISRWTKFMVILTLIIIILTGFNVVLGIQILFGF